MRQILLTIIFFTALSTQLFATELEIKTLGKIPIKSMPLQVVASPKTQKIYVLTKTGEVELYGQDGQLQGSAVIGSDVTSITLIAPDVFLVTKSDQKELSVVSLSSIVQINTTGASTYGPSDAPVEIVVFDDFECPYCAKAAPLLKQAQSLYPDKTKLIFKNFPLPFHKNAKPAALAGLAAERQGRFWQLHDLMFANQKSLSGLKIRELAGQIGLDMALFDKDMADPALQAKIQSDLQEGQRIGVSGTPSIYINGRQIQPQGIEALKAVIESELAKN